MDNNVSHLLSVWSAKGTIVPSELLSPQFKAQHESAKKCNLQFEHGWKGDSIESDYNQIYITGCPKNGTLWAVRNNAKFSQ